jgi:cytochrome c553
VVTEAAKRPDDMTRDELIQSLHAQREEGIRITFSGKDVAKQIARKVQPRAIRRLAKYSVARRSNDTGVVQAW